MDYRDPSTILLPTTDDEFERLCLLIARNKYGVEYFRYGIRGQKQHGIDIYSAYYNGQYLQCKLHKKKISDSALANELKRDLNKAKLNFADLKHFIFAISLDTRPVIQDICKELSDENLRVTPWFWNQMQEDISRSKWLLRYCLNSIPGAQWVSDYFIRQELGRGGEEGFQPIAFYSGISFAQWYGILKSWDAKRKIYDDVCLSIANSFADELGDIPVAAIIRGDGGTGKSVFLRRIAVDLRNHYTVYWIADNSEDFLQNEWIYDIEDNPSEKYLLVLEDWYRNFSKPDDRVTANRLIQKVKSKKNVRLLIGDRHSSQSNYPKSKTFELTTEENISLLPHIIRQVPEWKDKLSIEMLGPLMKTGLFQLLFVYQYVEGTIIHPKSRNYFIEIIESDYNRLSLDTNCFYRGLAHTLYIYANLYSDYSLKLSFEAIIILAETFSGVERPFELKGCSEALVNDPIVKRYLDTTETAKREMFTLHARFLHDSLADEGWKEIEVDLRKKFEFSASINEVFEVLRRRKGTKEDLSALLKLIVVEDPFLLNREKIISTCDLLIENQTCSTSYIEVLFCNPNLEIELDEQIDYIFKLNRFNKNNEGAWTYIVKWLTRVVDYGRKKIILNKLVESGNMCALILATYYDLLSDTELEDRIEIDFTIKNLSNSTLSYPLSKFWRRLNKNKIVKSTVLEFLRTEQYELASARGCMSAYSEEPIVRLVSENYLNSIEPWRIKDSFLLCLKMCKDSPIAKKKAIEFIRSSYFSHYHDSLSNCLKLIEDESLAKEKAREYLELSDAYKYSGNFTTCLKLIEDESLAKEKAREYLELSDAYKYSGNFTTCLKLIEDESLAKEKAREYLELSDAYKYSGNFTTCLKLIEDESLAKEKAREYLELSDAYKNSANFITCLKLIEDESLAKEKAREYLELSDTYKNSANFITCLKLIEDEALAKEKAREYLGFTDAKKVSLNFSTCLYILGEEASGFVKDILSSPIHEENPSIIYRALQMASEYKNLDRHAEKMILQIIQECPRGFDIGRKDKFYLYLQMLKISFFNIEIWQREIDRLLASYKTINRNVFYSLTLSHINNATILKDPCLYFVRNWVEEFSRPKKYWGYFIRCLSHPIIHDNMMLQEEIRSLSADMLSTKNCPKELSSWLLSISKNNVYPEWYNT
jgi:hypothetical protein